MWTFPVHEYQRCIER